MRHRCTLMSRSNSKCPRNDRNRFTRDPNQAGQVLMRKWQADLADVPATVSVRVDQFQQHMNHAVSAGKEQILRSRFSIRRRRQPTSLVIDNARSERCSISHRRSSWGIIKICESATASAYSPRGTSPNRASSPKISPSSMKARMVSLPSEVMCLILTRPLAGARTLRPGSHVDGLLPLEPAHQSMTLEAHDLLGC